MNASLKNIDEKNLLEQLNSMGEEEIADFRRKNQEHDEKIAQRTVRNFISLVLKRTIDLLAGIVGTLLLIPLTIIVWVLNLINKENGPIFYEQLRIGKNGKIFRIYKFRSMVIGADDVLEKYLKENPEAAEEFKTNKKLQNDPRITKTGKFLRETSLDEWPQFFCILIGKMSLVGPRPYLPREKEDMGEYYDYIIKMKPGLTGPWQVAGRANLSFEDRLKLDEEYCSRRGNRRDLMIIFKTIKRVLKREGAV